MKFNTEITKSVERPEKELTQKEYILAFIKIVTNPLSMMNKYFADNFSYGTPPAHLNNIINSDMNNVTAIDFV